jgi:hypothetical protein
MQEWCDINNTNPMGPIKAESQKGVSEMGLPSIILSSHGEDGRV